MTYLADPDPESALVPLQAAACTYRIAFGPRAGQKVLTLQSVPNRVTPSTSPRCVSEQGFSLHAEVRLAINQRHKLEHLCRYITRPAIANERLQRNGEGQVVLQLKTPYHDGTTHIVMEPLEFVASASPRSCPVPGCISSALYGRPPFVKDICGVVLDRHRLQFYIRPVVQAG